MSRLTPPSAGPGVLILKAIISFYLLEVVSRVNMVNANYIHLSAIRTKIILYDNVTNSMLISL